LPVSHLLYGLRFTSSLSIPGLLVSEGTGPTTLQIRLQERAEFTARFSGPLKDIFYTSPHSNPSGDPNLRAGMLHDGTYYGFFYSDGARFAIERQGREIWGDWPDDYSLEDASIYLIGQVINFALRLRGATSLHASSIAVGDRAIAVMGAPGAGKSTTAAAFAQLGFPILSDDVAVLEDRGSTFLVQPGYPRVNVWPDSARALFGPGEDLPQITPTWEKKYVSLDREGYRFQSNPLPLSAIYMLEVPEDAPDAPVLQEATAADAFIALVANTYLNFLLDADMRKREFEVLGRVSRAVPVRFARPGNNPSRVFEFCELIATDARRLQSQNQDPADAMPRSH
jgi:hypothetical protein